MSIEPKKYPINILSFLYKCLSHPNSLKRFLSSNINLITTLGQPSVTYKTHVLFWPWFVVYLHHKSTFSFAGRIRGEELGKGTYTSLWDTFYDLHLLWNKNEIQRSEINGPVSQRWVKLGFKAKAVWFQNLHSFYYQILLMFMSRHLHLYLGLFSHT